MLMFLAALQDIPADVDEAAAVDGANRWQTFRTVTLPMLRPTLFLVITLGLIGTWQVFDQVYVMSQGNPAKTTLTPAFLSYRTVVHRPATGARARRSRSSCSSIIIVMTSSSASSCGSETLPTRRAPAGQAPMTMTVTSSTRPAPAHGVSGRTRRSARSRLIVYLVLIVFALIYIYPFLIQLGTSFKTDAGRDRAPAQSRSRRPGRLDAFRAAGPARTSRAGSPTRVIVTVFVTVGRVFFDSLAGYALARLHFRGRGALFAGASSR